MMVGNGYGRGEMVNRRRGIQAEGKKERGHGDILR